MKIKNLLLAVSATILTACGEAAVKTNTDISSESTTTLASDMKLYALDCGSIIMQANLFDNNDGFPEEELRYLPVPCYLIRHPQGDIMWDAGIPDSMHETPFIAKNLRAWVERPMEDQLREIGVPPEEVDYLVVSHSHFDHAGNIQLFKNAKWVVTKEELDFSVVQSAQQPGVIMNLQNEFSENIIIEGDYDLFGDGRIQFLTMPGHTAGHMSLLLNLPNSGKILFSGDLYHFAESREKQLVPDFNFNEDQTRASMAKFEKLAEETGARVVIQHVQKDFESFPRFPAYID